MKNDPLLLIGLIMLGMALGALLMKIRFKSDIARIVSGQVAEEGKETELYVTKNAGSPHHDAA
jgi:hypothetical protein